MRKRISFIGRAIVSGIALLAATAALAGPVYQPPGANLTFGDVTHGQRIQSASGNPAAAAADLARGDETLTRGVVLSAAAGLEYGNVQNLFDFYDEVTGAYKPDDPGDGGGGPGQNPGDKPDDGIDLGDIWDSLDPDFQATIEAVGKEVAIQTALLALIREEGYGKAWLSADAPFIVGGEYLGGAWTFGVNWSGTAKAFGLVEAIDFDADAAEMALEDWFNQLPINRPVQFNVSDEVLLAIEPVTDAVKFVIQNDSSMLSKGAQMTELNVGYSRHVWSNSAGSLYLGAEARLYLMRLSRLTVRFGDITNSEELFDYIFDHDFRNDEALGVDIGALWVGENYQFGAQLTNVNEPKFNFPEVNLDLYNNLEIIGFLMRDQSYIMDRQLKLEASLFTGDRRWSAHLGVDADSATDPMGDKYQWLTLSTGFITDSRWIPSARIGYRQNLAGTELNYLSIGLTAFKVVNIDIASALDTVRIDGTTLPQGLMVSIGFQVTW
jgi:hypothetical protein